MPIGAVTNRSLKPVATSAGNVHVQEKDFPTMTMWDLLALAHAAARKLDGLFSIAASAEGAGGIQLTVTTNAGVVTIGPFPFPRDSVNAMLDYQAREGHTLDGL